ncbi:MAG: hypothetical protein GF363_04820 [Chitinivibrionales bacterium]|nr:hypothetical protein [Chitinivibrionales bacterium]
MSNGILPFGKARRHPIATLARDQVSVHSQRVVWLFCATGAGMLPAGGPSWNAELLARQGLRAPPPPFARIPRSFRDDWVMLTPLEEVAPSWFRLIPAVRAPFTAH